MDLCGVPQAREARRVNDDLETARALAVVLACCLAGWLVGVLLAVIVLVFE